MKTLRWSALGVMALSQASSACIDPSELDPAWTKAVATREFSWGTGRSAGEARSECSSDTVEKLGVRFVRLCASDRLDGGWIAVEPLECSTGAHGTIPCPVATPLLRGSEARPASPASYMLSDGETGHRVCAMRFGGRLATTVELRELRDRMDAGVVIAHREAGGAIAFDELPEWTGEGGCSHPTLPEADCRFEMRPTTKLVRTLPWRTLQACEFEADGTTDTATPLGRSCPAKGDCRVERKWRQGAGRDVWSARCRDHAIEGEYPMVKHDVALVRCVAPPSAFPEAR